MNITHSFVEVVPREIIDMSNIERIYAFPGQVIMYTKNRSDVDGEKTKIQFDSEKLTEQFKEFIHSICGRDPW